MSAAPSLDPQRQARAREYARLRRRLFVVDLAVSGVLTLAWVAAGWAPALRESLAGMTRNEWLLVPAFGAVFFLTLEAAGFPLSFYSSYRLPHRFDLSNQTLGGWLKDEALGLVLGAALGLPLLEAVYWLLRATGQAWWLWAAIGYTLIGIVLTNLAPVVIMPLFNRYVPLGQEHGELVARLQALARRAGTRVSGIFRFDMSRRTKAANAALAGLGGTRRIILGDTLLNEFTVDEVETVIAHELGHQVNRDIPLIILVNGASALAALYLTSVVLNAGIAWLGLTGPADIAGLPLLALVLGVFGLLTLPVGNAFSRWREVLADEFALTITHKPQAFADAMTRLANQNLAEADPEPWVVFLLYSHPPIRDRLARAAAWQARPATTV